MIATSFDDALRQAGLMPDIIFHSDGKLAVELIRLNAVAEGLRRFLLLDCRKVEIVKSVFW